MYTQVESLDERHQFVCQDGQLRILLRSHGNRWKIHELLIRAQCSLMAITNCGRYVAFVDDDDHTLYVCSFSPNTGLRELARIQNFPVQNYLGLEWIDPPVGIPSQCGLIALQGVYQRQCRNRHEGVWHTEVTAVA